MEKYNELDCETLGYAIVKFQDRRKLTNYERDLICRVLEELQGTVVPTRQEALMIRAINKKINNLDASEDDYVPRWRKMQNKIKSVLKNYTDVSFF